MKGRIVYQRDGTKTYYVNGRLVTEAEFNVAFPPQRIGPVGGTPRKGWPIYSDALGVHPDQVAEHAEAARQRGVPTDCLPDGRVVLRDRAHRREYLRRFGFHDKDGGYGDG